MTTSINVDKRSVKQLLETGKNKRFIIPEYQRPYAWSDEQIQVLFDDLTEYTLNTTEDEAGQKLASHNKKTSSSN